MQYVGIQTQQSRNNFRSLLLLCLFPCLVMGLLFAFCYLLHLLAMNDDGLTGAELLGYSTGMFIHLAPYVLGGVLIWFIIAYFANTSIINSATGSEPLSRMENKRVYNLVENLCMSQGMKMPKINIINDDSLNAFASGINERTYTVSLSRGIIDKLDDLKELPGEFPFPADFAQRDSFLFLEYHCGFVLEDDFSGKLNGTANKGAYMFFRAKKSAAFGFIAIDIGKIDYKIYHSFTFPFL